MVRPREGGFCYSETEYAAMLADARALLAAGADGLAFGFLHDDGTVDEARTREFVALCGEKEAVFHRAFDVTPDRDAAMQTLIACGVKRVLTSGGACDAPSGKDELRRLQAAYGRQIEILPGGGIRAENAAQLAAYTASARCTVRRAAWYGIPARRAIRRLCSAAPSRAKPCPKRNSSVPTRPWFAPSRKR